MDINKQIIAAAEFEGWTEISKIIGKYDMPTGIHPIFDYTRSDLPRYDDDLNAIRKLEEIIDKKKLRWEYIDELTYITGAEWTDALEEVFVVAHASAAQKLEAIVKMLNKWEDES